MVRNTPSGSISDVAKQSIAERIKAMDYNQFLLMGILAALVYGFPWGVSQLKDFAKEQRAEFREEREAEESRHRAERIKAELERSRQIEMLTSTYRESLGLMEKKRDRAAAVNPENSLPGTD